MLLSLILISSASPSLHAPGPGPRFESPGPPGLQATAEETVLSLTGVLQTFQRLYAEQDVAGCIALWKSHPHWALVSLAADLEGALALLEAAPETDAVTTMHARALWGARLGPQAGLHVLPDYAAAFVGWDEDERRLYRQGQDLYRAALDALAEGDGDQALQHATDAYDHAVALGDWWGAALAWSARGEAEREIGGLEDALASFSRARNLYRSLGLLGDELAAVTALATVAGALEQDARGLEAVRRGLELQDRLRVVDPARAGDTADRVGLLRLRAAMQARGGDEAGAKATRAEIEALEKRG